MEITISIVVPVYNVAPYLCDCLDSILFQTYQKWEAICVNDGSTDKSGYILDQYSKRDSRFTIVHQSNQGVSAARNCGLDESHGSWVIFMDSDDVIVPDALEKIVNAVNQYDCDIVTFGMCRVTSARDKIENSFAFKEKLHNMECVMGGGGLVRETFPHRLWAWNKCIKRSLIGSLRFENFQPCEDAVFVLECMIKARRILELPDVLYKYLQHDGSCLSNITAKKLMGNIKGMHRLTEVLIGWRFFPVVRSDVQRVMRHGFAIWIARDLKVIDNSRPPTRLLETLEGAVWSVFCQLPLFGFPTRTVYRIMLRILGVRTFISYLAGSDKLMRSCLCTFRRIIAS